MDRSLLLNALMVAAFIWTVLGLFGIALSLWIPFGLLLGALLLLFL